MAMIMGDRPRRYQDQVARLQEPGPGVQAAALGLACEVALAGAVPLLPGSLA
jgi:hypothetical protein